MPATAAQARQTWLDVIEHIHDNILGVGTASITDGQDVITNYKGDIPRRVLGPLGDCRRALVAVLAGPALQMYEDAFRDWCRAVSPAIDYDNVGLIEATRLIRHYLDDVGAYAGGSVDSKVTSRDWTRGSAASPTSTQIIQLLTDEYSQAIEDGYEQINSLEVVSSIGGTPIVRMSGERDGNDLWHQELTQAGKATPLDLLLVSDLNEGGSVVSNPYFKNLGHTTDASVITQAPSGWTHTVAANSWTVESTAASLYRGLTTVMRTGSTAANHTIYQPITRRMDPRIPYVPAILVKNDASFQGAFTLTWGNKTQQFTHADMDTDWIWIFADRDQDLWVQNFDVDAATLQLVIDTVTANTFLVGGLGLFPLTRHIGSGRWTKGFCKDADPLVGARAIITDTIGASEGKIQQIHHLMCWIKKGEGSYLNTTGTTTIADP